MLVLFLFAACHSTDRPSQPTTDTERPLGCPAVVYAPVGEVAAEVMAGSTLSCAITAPPPPPRLTIMPMLGDWGAQFVGSADLPTGWGVVLADFNTDGHIDIFLPQPGQDELFFNDGKGNLRRADFPIETDLGLGASAADYNGDGNLDLFVANAGTDRLYRNDNGNFVDVTLAAGLGEEGWTAFSSAWGDIDHDGDLDLVVANYYTESLHENDVDDGILKGDPNRLFLNNGDGTFLDVSTRLTGMGSFGWTYAIGFYDLNDDGHLDLYVVNDKDSIGFTNILYLNDGNGCFQDDGGASYTNVPVQGMGLAAGDTNDDLLPDLFVASWSELVLLESAGDGTYYDSSRAYNLFAPQSEDRYVAWGGVMEDMDNNGTLDIPVNYGLDELDGETSPAENPLEQPDAMFIQHTPGLFSQEAALWGTDDRGINRGLMVADLNEDGSLDLVTRDLYSTAKVYLSTCSMFSWSQVSLREAGPNPNAVGARLSVWSGNHRYTRWITAGSTSMASGGPPEAYFGLESATQIEHIDVRWPDGATSTLDGPFPVNTPLVINRL